MARPDAPLAVITGGAGFVGSNLARILVAGGWTVRVLDDLSIGSSAYLRGVSHDLVLGSLRDAGLVRTALTGADAVVHLAARAGIPDSIADPITTFDANVTQTVGLLDAARTAGVRRFVFASSNAVIGDHEPPSSETSLPHPTSPYGASKLAGEAYVEAYAAAYGIPGVVLRFSNVYGPHSLHKKSVVATWIRAALDGRPLTVHGDGRQTRDFVHVADLVSGIVAALTAPEEAVSGQLFQIGTGVETPVIDVADAIRACVGHDIRVVHGPERAGDVRRSVARIDRAIDVLRYRPRIGVAEGIASTADWFGAARVDPVLAAIVPDARSGSD